MSVQNSIAVFMAVITGMIVLEYREEHELGWHTVSRLGPEECCPWCPAAMPLPLPGSV